MNKAMIAATAAVTVLAACDSSKIADNTGAGFTEPSPTGVIASPDSADSVSDSIIFDGNGFAYKAGGSKDEGDDDILGIIAVAGIVEGTSVSDVPLDVDVAYIGNYKLITVGDFELSDDDTIITGQYEQIEGLIVLEADAAARTLTGTADELSINGRINGNELSGSVEFQGVDGDLIGVIDERLAIGAFNGETNDQIYAGGFYAEGFFTGGL